MAKKRQHPAHKSASAATGRAAPKDLDDLGLAEPPPEDDPKGRAEYLLQLLEAFAQQGTMEAKRLRSALIETISAYATAAEKGEEAKKEALLQVRVRLAGMEAGVMELLVRSTGKIRDKVQEQARRLGTRNAAGQHARDLAEGMTQIVDALQTMLRAGAEGRKDLREAAQQKLDAARKLITKDA